ncbi:MAG: c-type cytochrome [Planctomycetaceae bacterium]
MNIQSNRQMLSLCIASTFLILTCSVDAEAMADSHAIVPGYERFRVAHLSPAEAGRLLISELNCQSCHGRMNDQVLPPREAPVLTNAGNRVSVDFLKTFLADPQHIKPGTAMPAFAALQSKDGKPNENAEALAAFLASDSTFRYMAIGADSARRGEKLFRSIGCAACHGDQRQAAVDRPAFAMPLGNLSEKYSLTSLSSFLSNPHAVRPSGRMPSLNLSPEELRDVTSYLLRDLDQSRVQANVRFEEYHGSWEQLPDFSQLTPVSTGLTTDITVEASSRRETFALRFSGFLQIPKEGQYRIHLSSDDGSRVLIDGQPVLVADGIHPAGNETARHQMNAGPHEVVVEYFEYHGQEELKVEISGNGLARQPMAALMTVDRQPAAPEDATPETDSSLIEEGRQLFASLGCAACHQHGQGDQKIQWTKTAPTFQNIRSTQGCLSPSAGSNVPVFALTEQQRSDIVSAIEADQNKTTETATREQAITRIMTTLNCYTCHQRDGLGGVPNEFNELFTGSIPEMGDEGRIPPHLNGVGDKLNPDWLKHVLNEGAKDRPYMATRMPKFGASNVGALLTMLEGDQKNEVDPVEFAEAEHRVKADARLMIGDQALSCIKCHYFDKFAATGIQSIDMTTMTKRLRRDWFHRYLSNPQAYRPGTRMPAAWPNGKSVVPKILDGTAPTQIEAIWKYLEDGKQAKIPSGLQTQAIELVAKERPLIYRNFIEGLSPRGIAVAFPEKAHFAWDAEQMNMRLIWHGAFIDASKHWVGRGPGFQAPLGDHMMTLPSGPAVAVLPSTDSKWPSDNAREMGYRFLGYTLDKSGVPAFRFRTPDGITVHDQIKAQSAEPDAELTRTITLTPASDTPNACIRIATGELIEQTDGEWVIDNAIRIRSIHGQVISRKSSQGNELLLLLPLKANTATEASYTIHW